MGMTQGDGGLGESYPGHEKYFCGEQKLAYALLHSACKLLTSGKQPEKADDFISYADSYDFLYSAWGELCFTACDIDPIPVQQMVGKKLRMEWVEQGRALLAAEPKGAVEIGRGKRRAVLSYPQRWLDADMARKAPKTWSEAAIWVWQVSDAGAAVQGLSQAWYAEAATAKTRAKRKPSKSQKVVK